MNKYYSEDIIKNTKERQYYVDSIEKFLNDRKILEEKNRNDFISPEKYKNNPEFYRQEYVKMLGFPLTESRQMPDVEKIFVSTDKNVDIYRLHFTFPCGIKGYGLYFKQIERKNQPFILGLHGGAGTPEIVSSIYMDSANYNHLVRRLTDKGADVFVPQLLLWDINTYGNEYNRHNVDGQLRQLGGSITALEVWLMSSYIDWFEKNEDISKEKIGVAGLSYGGMYAIHLSAFDTRIKSVYSCSWLADSFAVAWADWSYKDAQKTFTSTEVSSLISPRNFVVAMGNKDELFDYNQTVEASLIIKEYYKIFNCENNFKCVIFNGVHETDKSNEEIDCLLSGLAFDYY